MGTEEKKLTVNDKELFLEHISNYIENYNNKVLTKEENDKYKLHIADSLNLKKCTICNQWKYEFDFILTNGIKKVTTLSVCKECRPLHLACSICKTPSQSGKGRYSNECRSLGTQFVCQECITTNDSNNDKNNIVQSCNICGRKVLLVDRNFIVRVRVGEKKGVYLQFDRFCRECKKAKRKKRKNKED